MSFLQRNNFGDRGQKIKIIPIAGILFLIFIFSFSGTRNLVFAVGSPLWGIKNSIASFFSNSAETLKSKSELIKENETLKEQIKTFEENNVLSSIIKNENDDLKNILGRKPANKKTILAAILVKPFLSPYDTLIVDVGSADGVSLGDKILADGITFIGYVSEVFSNESKIMLYSSPGEKIKVLIGNNNIQKEAEGVGGGNFIAEMPKEAGVKEGDPIVIPSISANIFGVVEKINFKEADSLETVLFKNPVNISELKWVLIVPENKNLTR